MMARTPYVAVVGAVNLDVCGTPDAPLVAHDSNPGRVRWSLGGVGRNIAHDLALLGVEVTLITALGDDLFAHTVTEHCRHAGIDLSHSLTVPGGATSTYLVLADHTGEMELAVSDMALCDRLTPAVLAERLAVLNGAAAVVVEANLPAPSLSYLAERCTAPLFADPVSTAKAPRLRPILGRLHTCKPNRMEAALLSGVDIDDEPSLALAARRLLETGMERVYLSLGSEGVLCADRDGMGRLGCLPGEQSNTTGCGDAFMAALVWSHLQGLDRDASARAGLAAAAITLASAQSVAPALNEGSLREAAGLKAPEQKEELV